MIRRLIDSTFVLIFVWAFMLAGLWIINRFIVPSEFFGSFNNIASGITKVVISAILVLVWLWAWREIVKKTFWRVVKQQKDSPVNNQKR